MDIKKVDSQKIYWFEVTGDKEIDDALFSELSNLTGKEKWNYPIPQKGDIWFNEKCGLTCCQPANKIARMAMMVGTELRYEKVINLNNDHNKSFDLTNTVGSILGGELMNVMDMPEVEKIPSHRTADNEIKNSFYVDYFDDIVKEMSEIHKRKNADYGNNFHKRYEKWGFLTALLRLSDKMERLEDIYEKGEIQVKDESVEDTLIDLANYAVMTAVELRNEKK